MRALATGNGKASLHTYDTSFLSVGTLFPQILAAGIYNTYIAMVFGGGQEEFSMDQQFERLGRDLKTSLGLYSVSAQENVG